MHTTRDIAAGPAIELERLHPSLGTGGHNQFAAGINTEISAHVAVVGRRLSATHVEQAVDLQSTVVNKDFFRDVYQVGKHQPAVAALVEALDVRQVAAECGVEGRIGVT